MSFRVWFLRMVWIVAAAVALSGCNGDDPKDPETPAEGEDGLAIAIDPAAPKAGEKITITVTVTGELDGKVNIGVDNCGEGDALLATAEHDATDSKATAEIAADTTTETAEGKQCKITATANVGGEDMTKEHEFAVAAASAPAEGNDDSYELNITLPAADAMDDANNDTAIPVTVEMTKGADAAALAADITVALEVACVTKTDSDSANGTWAPAMSDDTTPAAITWDVVMASTFNGGKETLTESVKHNNANDEDCYIRAKTTVGSDEVMSDPVKIIERS